ncbi:MAG TPA: bifunctional DNA primase/polymerase [Puia sp.]|uniref:bifunctional DNA primase/polymerase n=1 Tax=Puia sp. TaxID=2045100 RepID=UPI002BF0B9BF|nr:bifunctional DNA primase/polymerase [Puia sp.]HVU97728.1 bifunctional DNA primase/polymerase [Puia sp.]
MNELVSFALQYRQWGLSVVPVQANKKSVSNWKRYQQWRMSPRAIRVLFNHPLAAGIAVVCGPVSGNMLVIDIDVKNDLSGCLVQSFGGQVRSRYPDIFQKLTIASTRSSGYHFLFRCDNPGRCMVLARRPTTDQERLTNPHVRVKVLIETKATGGYVVVYPTQGYRVLRGNLQALQVLSEVERNQLFDLARSFNTLPDLPPIRRPGSVPFYYAGSPFADYNARGDFEQVLLSYGWTFVRENAERTYYRRPGETDHDTSGNYHHALGLFVVFSTSTEFIPRKGYRPAAIYAVLECRWDFKLAAKRLIDAGFGTPYWKMRQ